MPTINLHLTDGFAERKKALGVTYREIFIAGLEKLEKKEKEKEQEKKT
jgi:hypothetical protein